MARKRTTAKRLRQALEAPLTRLGLAVVPPLPRPAILALARWLGAAAYVFSARSRRIGLANLDLAFGETKSAAEKRRILRRSMQNFALVLLDLLWFMRDSAARMERWFVPSPEFRDSMSRRVARVGITGHFGNWELCGRYWSAKSGALMSVAMPIKNPAVDRMLQGARQVTGQQVIPREGALKKLVRHLRGGGTVGLLLDQNTPLSDGGIFVEFFGRPVAVSPAAGILAPMTGAEIQFGFALPDQDGVYHGEIFSHIPSEEIAAMDRTTAARELTQRITGFYEEVIRDRPEYWLWTYRRWRYIPPGSPANEFPFYAKPSAMPGGASPPPSS